MGISSRSYHGMPGLNGACLSRTSRNSFFQISHMALGSSAQKCTCFQGCFNNSSVYFSSLKFFMFRISRIFSCLSITETFLISNIKLWPLIPV